MGEKLFLSDNGFEMLFEYFEELYGDLGSINQIINRYINGIDFSTNNRIITKLEDIPLITSKDIDQIIQYEKTKEETVQDFIEKYEAAHKKGKLNERNYLYLASLLGVVPYACTDSAPIYDNLLSMDLLLDTDIKLMRKGVLEHPKTVGVMVDGLYKGFKNGMVIRISDKGRNVWHNGNAVNYYRGESAYYGKSQASLFRTNDGCKFSREEFLIKLITIADFSLFLRKIPFISKWPFGDVFYPGIAQHYGIPTSYIDITKDFKVALFFACTKWEKEKRCWRSLTNDDFKLDGNRADIFNCGGDPRYGIIYRAPADINNLCASQLIEHPQLTPVYPMGYQPFLRCEKQSAYYISTAKDYNLYLDPTFEKYRFELTEELCKKIFDEMHQGADIYPKDVSGDCSDIIESLRSKKEYSETALDYILKEEKIENEKKDWIGKFEKLGYKMKDKLDFDTDDIINRFEKEFVRNNGYEMFNQRDLYCSIGFCI